MEMEKKYKLTDETLQYGDKKLYRIQALRDIQDGLIPKGSIGGWVENENNLSQKGECWIFDNAKVLGHAKVEDNASIYHNAIVSHYATVQGNARISNFAIVSSYAHVSGNATVCGYSKVLGSAVINDYVVISEHSQISDNAKVSGMGKVLGHAKIYDYADISGCARIDGYAKLSENAVVSQEMVIKGDFDVTVDLTDRKNIQQNLIAQCGLLDCDGKVTCYKAVNDDLTSIYDPTFKYEVGKWAVCENPNMSDDSCVAGLHFGPANYQQPTSDIKSTYLVAEVSLDDIITIQEGKIRCKKAFIKGVVKL